MPPAFEPISHPVSSLLPDSSSDNGSCHTGIVRAVDVLSEDPFLTQHPANQGNVIPIIPPPPSRPASDNNNHVELAPSLYENERVSYRTFDPEADVEDHGYQGGEESQHLMDVTPENGRRVFIEREVHWEERVGVVVLWIIALPLLLAALYICLDLFLLKKSTGSGGGDRKHPR
ncbi:hypothetical protein QBC36DRAFT_297189 [Triangularia setosa]|uniref:Uncharacterized protein n=1 Tax=Triangularia setosa TaxID=2587417 RepID=A0AAN6WFM0_9PEZI|nr:hypothetical protein QBC36DRAFT_297189 [Podospora setosa]